MLAEKTIRQKLISEKGAFQRSVCELGRPDVSSAQARIIDGVRRRRITDISFLHPRYYGFLEVPANTRRWPNTGLVLVQRRQCLVFLESIHCKLQSQRLPHQMVPLVRVSLDHIKYLMSQKLTPTKITNAFLVFSAKK